MVAHPENPTMITTKIRLLPKFTNEFADWQAKLHVQIADFPGFISLEILSPIEISHPEWMIIQRFIDSESLFVWRESKEKKILMKELEPFLAKDKKNPIKEIESAAAEAKGNVTEVFVTRVSPNKEIAYREWIAKIHRAEAKFPGFRGVYVQSPSKNQEGNWITLLQFDTQENLDRWLASPEREEVLRESEPLIASLESHRVISPYAGWFSSIAKKGELPPVWKQTMIVLLVLFPIVMLELKFLPLLTANLNSSLGTFIGNAISVTLISWPMMPIAIWFLGWWLSPKPEKYRLATLSGTLVLILLYLIEIAIFWNLL